MSLSMKFAPRDGNAQAQEGDDDPGELFAVVAEFSNQGPILMETEGPHSSYERAMERVEKLAANRTFLRACIVRLVYETGNSLVLHDMKRMQK